MILVKKTDQVCWICGNKENLTGEHKIKKSDLKKSSYGPTELFLVTSGKRIPIQGINSNYLKFKRSICAHCNNQRTQQSDYNYDTFRNNETEKIKELLFSQPKKQINISKFINPKSRDYLDLLRYFAKALGCQIHYNKFPIPRRLSRFVYHKINYAPISIRIGLAPWQFYESDTNNTHDINGIGGIALQLSKNIVLKPYLYQTAFMTDGLQFIISMNLSRLESFEIWLCYRKQMGKVQFGLHEDEAKHLGF